LSHPYNDDIRHVFISVKRSAISCQPSAKNNLGLPVRTG
jgi:hypothetical protein